MAGWAGAALDRAGFGGGMGGGAMPSEIVQPVQTLGGGFSGGGLSLDTPSSVIQPAQTMASPSSALTGMNGGTNRASDLIGSYGSATGKASSLIGGFGGFQSAGSLIKQAAPSALTLAQQQGGLAGAGQGVGQEFGGSFGGLSNAGGKWQIADGLNAHISSAVQQVKQQTGLDVPPNLVKSMLYREGGGKGLRGEGYLRGEKVYGFNGIFQSTARSWGIDYDRMLRDDAYAVYAMTLGLSKIANYQFNGQSTLGGWGWEGVATTYFKGNPVADGWSDELGNTAGGGGTNDYLNGPNGVITDWKSLDALAPSTAGTTPQIQNGIKQQMGTPAWQAATGGNPQASSVLAAVQQYVGVRYSWGGIPGKGADPWATGWDCSGFTYWVDQNFGSGTLPQGSHYQYQWAQQNGRLFTDANQLQPGDVIFLDTGVRGGGGANLNGASHVGIYLGNDKFIHAANEQDGTIISSFTNYTQQYQYLGAMKMSFSGGAPGATAGGAMTNMGGGSYSGAASARPGTLAWYMSFLGR